MEEQNEKQPEQEFLYQITWWFVSDKGEIQEHIIDDVVDYQPQQSGFRIMQKDGTLHVIGMGLIAYYKVKKIYAIH